MKNTTVFLAACLLVAFFVVVPSFLLAEEAIKAHYTAKVQTAILECKVKAMEKGNSSEFVQKVCSVHYFGSSNK